MSMSRADCFEAVRKEIACDSADIQDEAILAIAAGVNPKDAVGRMKPGLRNVPPGPLYLIAQAFDDGASKYGAFNWRSNAVLASVYHDACKRHLDQWFHGHRMAADSGVHHLAHAVACLLIVLDAEQQGMLNDDRPQHKVALDDLIAGMSSPCGVFGGRS